jgi:two-component system, OmpR family, phosphate regulon sensor histidine kinase PhoR
LERTLLTEIINALPDAAVVVDAAGRVTAANLHAAETLQLEPVGLQVVAILRNTAFVQALEQVQKVKGAVSVEIETLGRPPRQFGVHLSPLGKSTNILILLRDLTREQRIEKMRSDFVANASHEMRTPLATIIGTIETLQGAAKNDPKARERFLETMMDQGKRMRRLIDDLLILSKIELNEHVRPNARINLIDIAKQTRSNLSSLAQELKVDVTIEDAQPIIVSGDSDELMQVLQNLLENAIKYGASGGRIVISSSLEGRFGVIKVRDFGNGIAPEHLPRLTERFYRVNTQESRARGGTGLGLAIVKHIVSRHQGRLDIKSTPGQGSIFSVLIPLYITAI